MFVLLEGDHDVAVIGEWLRDELESARATIVQFGGTHNIANFLDTSLLMDFTDAQFVVVVDNARRAVFDIWRSASELAAADRKDAAHAVITRGQNSPSRSSEELRLLSFFRAALRRLDEPGRLSAFGLRERDIFRYLPVQVFVPDASSWPT